MPDGITSQGSRTASLLTSPIHMPRCAIESSVVYAASHSHGCVPARGEIEVRGSESSLGGDDGRIRVRGTGDGWV